MCLDMFFAECLVLELDFTGGAVEAGVHSRRAGSLWSRLCLSRTSLVSRLVIV